IASSRRSHSTSWDCCSRQTRHGYVAIAPPRRATCDASPPLLPPSRRSSFPSTSSTSPRSTLGSRERHRADRLTTLTSNSVTRTIHVAHSPDSDDAFMFYALAEGKVDTNGLRYVHELQDIESLNQRALRGELEVTAVSIHAYAYLADTYALLPHGASMGDQY